MQQQSAMNASMWKNNSNICILRSPVSFFTEGKYDGTNKLCGSSQSVIVLPTSEPCPFVNISYANFTLEDHVSVVTDTPSVLSPLYVSYNSTSPYSFYSYPISKFTVSEYYFCLMDQDTGIDPTHSDFILLNSQRGCASSGNYTTLDSISEITFYSVNPNMQALVGLNGFPSPGNFLYSWGFSSLPGWTYKCRHTFNNKFSIPNAISQFNF